MTEEEEDKVFRSGYRLAILTLKNQANHQKGWAWCGDGERLSAAYEEAADLLTRRAKLYELRP